MLETIIIITLMILAWAFISLCVETNSPMLGMSVMVLAIVAAIFWFSIPLLTILRDNWSTLLLGVIGYLCIGVLWSVFRWYRFVGKLAQQYNDARNQILSGKDAPSDDLGKEKLRMEIRSRTGIFFPIKVKDYQSKLYTWLSFWPFSMSWTLINDPVTWLFNTLSLRSKVANFLS